MTSQPKDKVFLFVNKDLASQKLSQSGSKEHARMLSHVRSKHVTSKQPWRQYTTVLNVTEDSTVGDRDKSTGSVTQDVVRNINNTQARTGAPWLRTLKHNESVYAYLSTSWPSATKLKPYTFTTGDADITELFRLLGKLAEHHNLPEDIHINSAEPAHFTSKNSPGHNELRPEEAKARDRGELLLYSSIAHGSSVQAWRSGHVGNVHSQFWIGKTLQALRQQLSRPETTPDTSVVLSVFMLAMAALSDATPQLWADNPYVVDEAQFETCRTHLRAMLTLVDKTGGWHKFDPYVLEGMLLVDKYAALYNLSRPLIPLTAFDPGDYVQLEFSASRVPSQDRIPDIATAFNDLEIDPDLKKILQGVGSFYHAAAGIWKPNVKLTPQQESLVYRRFQSIHYKLLLVQTTNASSELVRLATLVVLCNATLYGAGLVFTRITSHHLYTKMMQILAHEGQTVDRKIEYWCLCTGATTRLPLDAKHWFVKNFLNQTMGNDLRSMVAAIRSSMQKYLYVHWLQDVELEAIIKKKEGLIR